MSIDGLFLSLITIAACSDLLTRRIPNALNFILLFAGVLASTLGVTHTSWTESCLGIIVALGVLFVPFALRVYQGGDVKLCMGMGAWLGVKGVLWTIGLGVVGGGVLALFMQGSAKVMRRPTRSLTVPMAVSFSVAGGVVATLGAPPW